MNRTDPILCLLMGVCCTLVLVTLNSCSTPLGTGDNEQAQPPPPAWLVGRWNIRFEGPYSGRDTVYINTTGKLSGSMVLTHARESYPVRLSGDVRFTTSVFAASCKGIFFHSDSIQGTFVGSFINLGGSGQGMGGYADKDSLSGDWYALRQ